MASVKQLVQERFAVVFRSLQDIADSNCIPLTKDIGGSDVKIMFHNS